MKTLLQIPSKPLRVPRNTYRCNDIQRKALKAFKFLFASFPLHSNVHCVFTEANISEKFSSNKKSLEGFPHKALLIIITQV